MAMKDKGKKGKGSDEDEEESEFMGLEEMFRKLKAGVLNGAMYLTGDKDKPVLIAAHKRKNPEFLGKKAKKEAGTAKGGFGSLRLDAGELIFETISEKVPKSLKKKLKILLKAEGFAKYKPRVLLPGGVEQGEEDDEDEEDEALQIKAPGGSATKSTTGKAGKDDGGEKDPLAEKEKEAAAAEMSEIGPRLEEMAEGDDEKAAEQAEKLIKLLAASVEKEDWKKVRGIIKVARKLVDAGGVETAEAAEGGAEAEADAAEDKQGDREAMVRERLNKAGASVVALREEVDSLNDDLEAALADAAELLDGGEDFDERREALQRRALEMKKRLDEAQKAAAKTGKELQETDAEVKAFEAEEKRIEMIRKRIADFQKKVEKAEEIEAEVDETAAAEEEAAGALDPEKAARLKEVARKKLAKGLF